MKARIASEKEQYEQAIRYYHQMTDLVPDFEIQRNVALAEALANAGRKDEAASQLAGVLKRHPAIPEKTRLSLLKRQADWWVDAGDTGKALEAYESAISLDKNPKTLDALKLRRAEALLKSNRAKDAREPLEKIAWQGGTSNVMQTARELLEDNDMAPQWTGEQYLERAQRLYQFKAFAAALDDLDAIQQPALKDDAAWWRAKTLYRMRRRYKEATEALTPIAAGNGPNADEARFLLARALSRRDKDPEAIQKYRSFATRTPRAAKASQARFLAARLEFYLGRHAQALRALERLVGNGHPRQRSRIDDPGKRRDAHFLAGMCALLIDKPKRAAPHFVAASAGASHREALERNAYWLAVAKTKTEKPQGVKALRAICEQDNTSWYAHLAAMRLKDLNAALEACELKPLASSPVTDDAAKSGDREADGEAIPAALPSLEAISPTVTLFYRAGLYRDAAAELRRLERSGEKQLTSSEWVALYTRLEASHLALRHAVKGLDWPPKPERLEMAKAAYPAPFNALFRETEREHQLPAQLLLAIARKESLFDPTAVSHVGAMGLMQMMPHTYEANRKRAKLPKLKAGALPGPEESIRAAGFEFAHLFKRYNGSLVLAIMGYNAGTAAVDRWLDRSGDLPTDVFVEKAGFTETRNYIRRVTRTLTRYRQLYGGDMPELPRIIERVSEPVAASTAESGKK